MSQAQLPVESYLANFNEALGAYKGIDFRQLCAVNPNAKGKAWIKSFRPKTSYDAAKGAYIEQTPLNVNLGSHIDQRMWNADTNLQTFANRLTQETPHQDIDFYFSAVDPKISETGHEFETFDEIQESNDPTSETMQILVNSFQVDRNLKVLNAVAAASVTRRKLVLDPTDTTNFGKVVTATESWSTTAPHNSYTTKNTGYFSFKDDAPMVRAMADSANVPDKEKLIMLINPHDAANMCVNSFDTMYSIDFVEKKHLEQGTLPEAFGISFVKSTLVPRGTMYAWLKSAVSWIPWSTLQTRLAENSQKRFHAQFYAWESNNFVRIDDRGVFVVNIKSSGGSGSGSGSGSGVNG